MGKEHFKHVVSSKALRKKNLLPLWNKSEAHLAEDTVLLAHYTDEETEPQGGQ